MEVGKSYVNARDSFVLLIYNALLYFMGLFNKMILKMKADKQLSWALWCLFSKFMVGSVYVSISLQHYPQILGQNKI